jgi:hypothetical protein
VDVARILGRIVEGTGGGVEVAIPGGIDGNLGEDGPAALLALEDAAGTRPSSTTG